MDHKKSSKKLKKKKSETIETVWLGLWIVEFEEKFWFDVFVEVIVNSVQSKLIPIVCEFAAVLILLSHRFGKETNFCR